MARKRFSAEQIIPKLREAEVEIAHGATVRSLPRRSASPSRRTTAGRRNTGGLKMDQTKRLKELEKEKPASSVREDRQLSPEDASRIELELETLGRDFKFIEESHGKNTLNLVVLVGYLKKLLANSRVTKFLGLQYPELLTEFQKIAEAKTLVESTE